MDKINWKEALSVYINSEDFDSAISLIQDIIRENPGDVDARIFMNELMMHILREPHSWDFGIPPRTPEKKLNYVYFEIQKKRYQKTAIVYYKKSTYEFKDNAKYLYFTSIITSFAPWYFGIYQHDLDIVEYMREKARKLEPDNLLYQGYPWDYKALDFQTESAICAYGDKILKENAEVFKDMGRIGQFVEDLKREFFQEYLAEFKKKNVREGVEK